MLRVCRLGTELQKERTVGFKVAVWGGRAEGFLIRHVLLIQVLCAVSFLQSDGDSVPN